MAFAPAIDPAKLLDGDDYPMLNAPRMAWAQARTPFDWAFSEMMAYPNGDCRTQIDVVSKLDRLHPKWMGIQSGSASSGMIGYSKIGNPRSRPGITYTRTGA